MPLAGEMKNTIDQIVSSYEDRIQNIGNLFNTTHEILLGFQDSFVDTKQERERLNLELRENLAKCRSLRRKDFDSMMQGIILTQNNREKEVRNLLSSYLNEQKRMAHNLRENLKKFRDYVEKGEARRIKEFQKMIKEVLARQEERKDQVTSKLKEFRKEQKLLSSKLRELLKKGRDLRIQDLKAMLKDFRTLSKERLDRQEEWKKEVRQLLGERKKVRN
jgi:uncharacterized phage infection (PIP) family protein YhgE